MTPPKAPPTYTPEEIDEALLAIRRTLSTMRYSADVSIRVGPVETLGDVVKWLDAFKEKLVGVSETATANEAELRTLQAQRAALRSLLGTAP